jgi:hypothetical protein
MRAGLHFGRLRPRVGLVVIVVATGSAIAVGTGPESALRSPFAQGEASAGAAPGMGAAAGQCANCGVVERVVVVRTTEPRAASRMSQAELGSRQLWEQGRTKLAVIGAVGGIPPGSHAEGMLKSSGTNYRISVLMADGSRRSVYVIAQPSVSAGDRVRIEGGVLSASLR